jgi:VanZ like family
VLVSLGVLGLALIPPAPVNRVLRMLLMPVGRGWHELLFTFNGVVLITVAALPLPALTVWALSRRRSATGTLSAWRASLAEVGLVYGTVPWVWITMLPGPNAGHVPGRVSLIPLQDTLTILAAGPVAAALQIGGNLLVFAALGFFAPIRFVKLASGPRIVALAAGCSILIETLQYVLRLDRVSSVDDVLLNTAGAALAALASRRWWRASS